jgi:hypothetical protein
MAGYLISKNYHLKTRISLTGGFNGHKELRKYIPVQIAIDRICEDHGLQIDKYKKLEQLGLISLNPLPANGKGFKKVEAILTKEGRNFLKGKRAWHTQTEGDVEQYIFYAHEIILTKIIVLSDAKEKTAEAEVLFKLSDPSKIQQIFNPVKVTEFKRNVNFKLSDDSWKVVENENSKLGIDLIDNPLHHAGN